MPRIPTYQPGQVGPVETTGARIAAVDNGGGVAGGLARGLGALGEATEQYAQVQDKINEQNDDTQARVISVEAGSHMRSIAQQFGTLNGGNARAGQEQALSDLNAARDTAMAQATTPRMQRFLASRLAALHGDAVDAVSGHALQQTQVERQGAFQGEVGFFSESAAGEDDPVRKTGLIGQAVTATNNLLDFQGVTDPQARQLALLKTTSSIHRDTLDRMLAQPDPDVDLVASYLDAHRGEMLSGDVEKITASLQAPLQNRIDDTRADNFMATLAPIQGERPPVSGGKVGPWQSVAVGVADHFGLKPAEVAAVMSYETGGTFSPTKMGGKGGNYMGLIQFGPAERAKYGITSHSTPAEWETAITSFLTDRGFKRGMGLLDLYSTVNAGSPGHYNASDGNGTVRTHVDQIMASHVAKAEGWLGGAAMYGSAPREWDRADVADKLDAYVEREHLSPEQATRLRTTVDRRMQRDEGLLHDQQRVADEQALTTITQMGDGFTSINQLPRAVRNNLSPQDTARYTAAAERNSKPKPPPSNGETAQSLSVLRITDPETFKATKLIDYVGKVTPSEMTGFMEDQARLGKAAPNAWSPSNGITSAVTYGMRVSGLDLKKEERAPVMQVMEAEANRLHAAGKPIDYNQLFRDATQSVGTTHHGWFGDSQTSMPAYKLTVDNMPQAKRNEIVTKFRQRAGRDPSNDELLSIWRGAWGLVPAAQ